MARQKSQIELPFRSSHGGKRTGAGRPNRSGLQSHRKRATLHSRHPVHVTLKMVSGLPSLRRKEAFRCLREAVRAARKKGLHVVHFAILSNHVHLILETKESSLRRPLQSLGISFAKRINFILKRSGAVLLERYHLHVLKTPTEARRALAYVLTNEAKHRGHHLRGSTQQEVSLDPFSSAYRFRDWRRLMGERILFRATSWSESYIESWYSEILFEARTWLLTAGWKLA